MSGNFINANTGPPSTTSLGYTICNILQPSTITSNTQNTLSIFPDFEDVFLKKENELTSETTSDILLRIAVDFQKLAQILK